MLRLKTDKEHSTIDCKDWAFQAGTFTAEQQSYVRIVRYDFGWLRRRRTLVRFSDECSLSQTIVQTLPHGSPKLVSLLGPGRPSATARSLGTPLWWCALISRRAAERLHFANTDSPICAPRALAWRRAVAAAGPWRTGGRADLRARARARETQSRCARRAYKERHQELAWRRCSSAGARASCLPPAASPVYAPLYLRCVDAAKIIAGDCAS